MEKNLIGGIVMEPKFITLPAVRLAGHIMNTDTTKNTKAVPEFWNAYLTDGRMEKLHKESFVKSHREYGACFPENPETGEFEYMIGVEFDGDAPDYQIRELPPATYAVFSTPPCDSPAFVASIQGMWNFIMNEWFPTSGYEYAAGCVDFELYDERCMGETGNVCDIYIPVVKK